MKTKIFTTLLCLVTGTVCAADRSEARIGVGRMPQAGLRAHVSVQTIPSAGKAVSSSTNNSGNSSGDVTDENESGGGSGNDDVNDDEVDSGETGGNESTTTSTDCRAAYRECMDEFCLLDESEGYRCACSSNIELSKSLIKEIQSIQEEADKLYTEGVERELLGAKAKIVFGESEAAKKSTRVSGLSFAEWLNMGEEVIEDEGSLSDDYSIGDGLYKMASKYCASQLDACPNKAEMETMLYSRQVIQDCKTYDTYLKDQKMYAQSNKRTAEAAVRKARLEVFGETNKYNRGECLLAYRSCIADKGGCGANFENCLDADLLGRRAHACENVLDQCMATRSYVLEDWAAESESILTEAAKYAEKNARATCLARIQVCLEDNCSTESNSSCLTNVDVAAGICPVIGECEELVPGIRDAINDKLFYQRTRFCQNDIDKCLRDKCGENFNGPECLGKRTSDIMAMCPQSMFPSCKGETQFNIILQAAMLQMDYQMLQGCVNYFDEQLGRACGTDMSCLPTDDTVASLTEVPKTGEEIALLRTTVRANSRAAVSAFLADFEKDITVAACQDARKPSDRSNLGNNVFNTARVIAEIGAENRAMRELEARIAELSREQDLEEAEQNCLNTYKVEDPKAIANSDDGTETKNYSYIRSVSFEPKLRNCHVCRMQRVCETGGMSKGAAGLQAAAGGLAAGASAGTMVTPGWGTAIGGAIGAVGGFFAGHAAGGKEEFCQEVESCEDINM